MPHVPNFRDSWLAGNIQKNTARTLIKHLGTVESHKLYYFLTFTKLLLVLLAFSSCSVFHNDNPPVGVKLIFIFSGCKRVMNLFPLTTAAFIIQPTSQNT